MRIVKTTKTIKKQNWIARRLWDTRMNENEKRLIEDLYGSDVVVLLPREKDEGGNWWLHIFKDPPLSAPLN